MYVVTVDVAKCESCGDCVDSCPNELIAMVEGKRKTVRHVQGRPGRSYRLLTLANRPAMKAL